MARYPKIVLRQNVGNQFADDRHAGQNHDVNGGMRVEPEEVLEQTGSPPMRESKMPIWKFALDHQQHQRDREHGRRQDLNDGGGVNAPDKQRHIEPAHAGRAQFVNRRDEVQSGEDRREAENEGRHRHQCDGRTGLRASTACKTSSRCRRRQEHDRDAHNGADHP